jgi:hypothetical protein
VRDALGTIVGMCMPFSIPADAPPALARPQAKAEPPIDCARDVIDPPPTDIEVLVRSTPPLARERH